MSYRLSSSSPVRLHLTAADARILERILRGDGRPDALRFAERLEVRITEATRPRHGREAV